MYYEVKILRKKYLVASNNKIYITAAKTIAKKYKIKFQDILKMYLPSNNLDKDKSWDTNGNIITV